MKSRGITNTEKLLSYLCDKTFLYLWSYSNPYKEDKKELCDLLAVFDNNVFIFFDRANLQLEKIENDPNLNWSRWKRKVIEPQIKTANGAERYIRNGGKIYLDKDIKQTFPIPIDIERLVVHKIIIAHGASEACLRSSENNIYGSLAISYSSDKVSAQQLPFLVDLDRNQPIHLFDSHNLPIILNELDTFYDFNSYLNAKLLAINKYSVLTYCGEEDLLANYFYNYDDEKRCHYIGTNKENVSGLFIGEGEWKEFIESEQYKRKKEADKVSYFWDELIQKTCNNALEGKTGGNANLFSGNSAIIEMAKEPRFMRRILSNKIIESMRNFPVSKSKYMRSVSLMPSFYNEKAYVFLQLKANDVDYDQYRIVRQNMLEIACGVAKNRFNTFKKIIGIAIDAPNNANRYSEDFLLLDCSEWSSEVRKHYDKENEKLKIFNTQNMKMYTRKDYEFPDDDRE